MALDDVVDRVRRILEAENLRALRAAFEKGVEADAVFLHLAALRRKPWRLVDGLDESRSQSLRVGRSATRIESGRPSLGPVPWASGLRSPCIAANIHRAPHFRSYLGWGAKNRIWSRPILM